MTANFFKPNLMLQYNSFKEALSLSYLTVEHHRNIVFDRSHTCVDSSIGFSARVASIVCRSAVAESSSAVSCPVFFSVSASSSCNNLLPRTIFEIKNISKISTALASSFCTWRHNFENLQDTTHETLIKWERLQLLAWAVKLNKYLQT